VIKGLYASFSAMDSAWKYQNVLANNIANAQTPGFKRELASFQSFGDSLISQSAPIPAPLASRIEQAVGSIGTGTFIEEFATDFARGEMQVTARELDLALDDGFFAVEGPDASVFYTRAGQFGRDANGDMVTGHGYRLLNTEGGHINLPGGPIVVGVDGSILVSGQPVGQIQIVDFAPGDLTRAGDAYFTSSNPGTPVLGGLAQGLLEMANSSLIEELTSLLTVQRVFQANQTIMSRLDSTLDLAAGQLGALR
jgi:flagellar basal-body rod protein FlgG